MKIIYQTEAGFKYLVYFMLLIMGFLALGFVQLAPRVEGGLSMLFFLPYLILIMPYIPLLISLTLAWDLIAEEKKLHKVFGLIFLVLSAGFLVYVWFKIGISVPALR
jgi:hypothetical protein